MNYRFCITDGIMLENKQSHLKQVAKQRQGYRWRGWGLAHPLHHKIKAIKATVPTPQLTTPVVRSQSLTISS